MSSDICTEFYRETFDDITIMSVYQILQAAQWISLGLVPLAEIFCSPSLTIKIMGYCNVALGLAYPCLRKCILRDELAGNPENAEICCDK